MNSLVVPLWLYTLLNVITFGLQFSLFCKISSMLGDTKIAILNVYGHFNIFSAMVDFDL